MAAGATRNMCADTSTVVAELAVTRPAPNAAERTPSGTSSANAPITASTATASATADQVLAPGP